MPEEVPPRVTIVPFSTRRLTFVAARDRCVIASHPEHARLLGIITAEWNSIEHYFVAMLSRGMGTHSKAVYPIAYAIISNRHRLKAMYAGLRRIIRSATHRQTLAKLYERTGEVLDKRNLYVHALYSDDGDVVNIIDASHVQQATLTPVTAAELEVFIGSIASLKCDLYDFLELAPWRVPRVARGASAPKKPRGKSPTRSPT